MERSGTVLYDNYWENHNDFASLYHMSVSNTNGNILASYYYIMESNGIFFQLNPLSFQLLSKAIDAMFSQQFIVHTNRSSSV